jgi:hypothetical protein
MVRKSFTMVLYMPEIIHVRRLISSMTMLLSLSPSPLRTHASNTAAWTLRSGRLEHLSNQLALLLGCQVTAMDVGGNDVALDSVVICSLSWLGPTD